MSEIEPASRLVPATPAVPMPPGPVSLWFVVLDTEAQIMGAARASLAPEWEWRDGMLAIGYGEVHVVMAAPGWYESAVIVAIPQAAELAALADDRGPGPVPYAPIFRIGLGESGYLRAGDDMHILDGVIAIQPEAAPGMAEPLR